MRSRPYTAAFNDLLERVTELRLTGTELMTGTELSVWLIIMRCTYGEFDVTVPAGSGPRVKRETEASLSELSHRTGRSRSQVARALRVLVAAHLLVRQAQPRGRPGGFAASVYAIQDDLTQWVDPATVRHVAERNADERSSESRSDPIVGAAGQSHACDRSYRVGATGAVAWARRGLSHRCDRCTPPIRSARVRLHFIHF